MTPIEILRRYRELGLPVHTYGLDAKGSHERDWPELATIGEIQEKLEASVGTKNFGILDGVKTPSGYLADVDLDVKRVAHRHAAGRLLIRSAQYGREPKPFAHVLYFTEKAVRYQAFENINGEMLLELRGAKKDGKLGLQTMVPPSIHPDDGERLEWGSSVIDIATVDSAILERRVLLAAVVLIILENTEAKHLGHGARLDAAGFFLKHGFTQDETLELLQAIAPLRGVNDDGDLPRVVETTVEKVAGDGKVRYQEFIDWVGRPVAERIREWLGAVDDHRELVLEDIDSIDIKRVEWLWEGRLPMGVMTLMAGLEGLGKSGYNWNVAARVTRGQLPGDLHGKPRTVIIVATEDSWASTIKPRLLVAGADLSRVKRLTVKTTAGQLELEVPTDVARLRKLIEVVGDVGLVILDPIMSRISTKKDTYKDAEVRTALEPLAQLADELRFTVVGVIHLNKSGNTGDLLSRIMGSRAFSAIVRSTLFVVEHPEDENQRVLVHAKSNLGKKAPSLGFRFEPCGTGIHDERGEIMSVRVVETGEIDMSAEEAVSASSVESRSDVARATEWLKEYLEERGGAADGDDAKKAGQREKLGSRSIQRGATKLRVHFRKNTPSAGKTRWELPGYQPELLPVEVKGDI